MLLGLISCKNTNKQESFTKTTPTKEYDTTATTFFDKHGGLLQSPTAVQVLSDIEIKKSIPSTNRILTGKSHIAKPVFATNEDNGYSGLMLDSDKTDSPVFAITGQLRWDSSWLTSRADNDYRLQINGNNELSAFINKGSDTLIILDSVLRLYDFFIRYIKIGDKVYPLKN